VSQATAAPIDRSLLTATLHRPIRAPSLHLTTPWQYRWLTAKHAAFCSRKAALLQVSLSPCLTVLVFSLSALAVAVVRLHPPVRTTWPSLITPAPYPSPQLFGLLCAQGSVAVGEPVHKFLFTEDIKRTGPCSHAQHRRRGEDTHAGGLPEGQKQEEAPERSPPRAACAEDVKRVGVHS
jgi:hypothetical protein